LLKKYKAVQNYCQNDEKKQRLDQALEVESNQLLREFEYMDVKTAQWRATFNMVENMLLLKQFESSWLGRLLLALKKYYHKPPPEQIGDLLKNQQNKIKVVDQAFLNSFRKPLIADKFTDKQLACIGCSRFSTDKEIRNTLSKKLGKTIEAWDENEFIRSMVKTSIPQKQRSLKLIKKLNKLSTMKALINKKKPNKNFKRPEISKNKNSSFPMIGLRTFAQY